MRFASSGSSAVVRTCSRSVSVLEAVESRGFVLLEVEVRGLSIGEGGLMVEGGCK